MRRDYGIFFATGDKVSTVLIEDGVSPSGKAADFGSAIRGFESLHPSQLSTVIPNSVPRRLGTFGVLGNLNVPFVD